ncbi:hypothetical protein PR001_g9602 [Phytophthora rubi]|uniref:Uncharacterized protein n=1 Tax=Phytophthora rubi TaxID=129364 RepID=A0A6A3MUH8_9STRA|nr:hypothetical protein PR001_g9602 [Phytophthora rubi]
MLWRLVMTDYKRIADVVRARFLPEFQPPPPPFPSAQWPPSVSTPARFQASPFDSCVDRSCSVNGIARCVPLGVFRRFQDIATSQGICFPVNALFLRPPPGQLSVPDADVQFLSALVRLPQIGINGTLSLFRGQTPRDQRPNKALRPQLYRIHLASYPDLLLLCSIAEHGVIPHWHNENPDMSTRPVSDNYLSAVAGSAVLTHRLLKDYYHGRCILARIPDLVAHPAFRSSAFALVPKKDIPLHIDCRTIHDLSAPRGASINDMTDSQWTSDARWDPFYIIAQRVLKLRSRYPDRPIYALGADIADAFLHVPVHAKHASAFGGTIPRTQVGIVSGSAVFGWTASPGYFAVFGKAVRHYQRTGRSYVQGFPEPFWSFQWVDDIVTIEVDIEDRLLCAEQRLRDGVKLVFGSGGWHEGKFRTWAQRFHAVGIDWNIPDLTVTIPLHKIEKTKKSAEFELIAQGYKRTDSRVDRKQPVTAPMLCEMHAILQRSDDNRELTNLLWGSIVIAFFFLDRSSELWGPVAKDATTGGTAHCVLAEDVCLRDGNGLQLQPGTGEAESVDIFFRSHKGDRTRQGSTIRHYKSG